MNETNGNPATPPTLADELMTALCDPGRFPTPDNPRGERTIEAWQRDAVLDLLNQRGHVLPGCPPAAKIFRDAKEFAERLTLSNLALRILNMLAWSKVETPETKPARKWIDDYLEGRNHGPVGHPMLWPDKLPGMAHMLRDWGFAPTPTRPAFVSRALPTATMQ